MEAYPVPQDMFTTIGGRTVRVFVPPQPQQSDQYEHYVVRDAPAPPLDITAPVTLVREEDEAEVAAAPVSPRLALELGDTLEPVNPQSFVTQEADPLSSKKVKYDHLGKQLREACQVCGDAAATHSHYGAIICFSCRAFFRRAVVERRHYNCVRWAQGACTVDAVTRTNCKKCRLAKCLRVGMKPQLVDAVKQQKERRSLMEIAKKAMSADNPILPEEDEKTMMKKKVLLDQRGCGNEMKKKVFLQPRGGASVSNSVQASPSFSVSEVQQEDKKQYFVFNPETQTFTSFDTNDRSFKPNGVTVSGLDSPEKEHIIEKDETEEDYNISKAESPGKTVGTIDNLIYEHLSGMNPSETTQNQQLFLHSYKRSRLDSRESGNKGRSLAEVAELLARKNTSSLGT